MVRLACRFSFGLAPLPGPAGGFRLAAPKAALVIGAHGEVLEQSGAMRADQFIAGQAERLAVPLEEEIEPEPADCDDGGKIVGDIADQALILAVRSKHSMDVGTEVVSGVWSLPPCAGVRFLQSTEP